MNQIVNNTIDFRWTNVFQQVMASPPHQDIQVPKLGMPHPIDQSFNSATGYLKGAIGQYSLRTPDGGRIHIREYQTYFVVHRDWGDPDSGLGGLLIHFFNDSPEVLLGLAGIVLLGLALRKQ